MTAELRDVLVLVEDLSPEDQRLCAKRLRHVLRSVEEREAMNWKEREGRRDKGKRSRREERKR